MVKYTVVSSSKIKPNAFAKQIKYITCGAESKRVWVTKMKKLRETIIDGIETYNYLIFHKHFHNGVMSEHEDICDLYDSDGSLCFKPIGEEDG